MRTRDLAIFAAAMLAGAIGGSLIGPRPAEAVAREIIELQQSVAEVIQGQKELATANTQDHTVLKTLIGQSNENVTKLSSTMGILQKSVQDVQANSGARLDTMSTQVQGLSDNLEEIKSRLGKLNQQLTDLQNAVQTIDAKLASGGSSAGSSSSGPAIPPGFAPATGPAPATPPPSADTLYNNGLRDIQGGKYDLARQEFQDYLKYYSETDLASNAQFYLGQIAYVQKNYQEAVNQYDKVLTNYPKSFKLAPARYRKGLALIELGQKTAGIRELREVIRRFAGTEEERQARAKLKELGVSVTPSR